MIDTDKIREIVVTGLKNYLGVEVIRSNQNEEPPEYPYIVYTITTLESENNGTYGEYDDGIRRKEVTQTWSISAVADTNEDSTKLAVKARDWLEEIGRTYMNDNDVICQSCSNITNRDNVLTVEYEYKNGFDAVFWTFSEVESTIESTGVIEEVVIGDNPIKPQDGYEHYDGEYVVTPAVVQQSLHTENKVMDDDVTVKAIPYYEVENADNGVTVIIGG